MKPLRLKMQAFGSYGKETTIDFEKVKKVQLVHVNNYSVMCVIVLDNSGVKTRKLHLDASINEEELFVSQNDHVIVKTLNGREIKGIFMQIEFARCLEEDDIVHVHKDNGENEGIPFDTIDDIIKG